MTSGGEHAARAGPVLHDDLLPYRLRELLGEKARREIGRAAGREADENANGFRGIRLRACRAAQQTA